MTEYEQNIKTDYLNKGYIFLFDTIGKNVKEVMRKVSNFGFQTSEIDIAQGECLNGAIGCSRWLVFKKGEDFNAEKSM